jgi:hypothetical protein
VYPKRIVDATRSVFAQREDTGYHQLHPIPGDERRAKHSGSGSTHSPMQPYRKRDQQQPKHHKVHLLDPPRGSSRQVADLLRNWVVPRAQIGSEEALHNESDRE